MHRDLKPANIKIGRDGAATGGRVKILDFGLAKALAPSDDRAIALSDSPTLIAEATKSGILLGTAPYMSPEQARGEEVDRRSDIWAFGVMLWEALTGRRPFSGDTLTDVLVGIVKEEPPWEELPAQTPASVRLVLHRCLAKSARQRLQAIGDARIELAESRPDAAGATDRAGEAGRRRSLASVVVVAVFAAAAAAALTWWAAREVAKRENADRIDGRGAARVIRTTLELPEDAPLRLGRELDLGRLALSPDGTTVVYVSESEGANRLYARSLDGNEVTPLAGTDGATGVFFSPDASEVGFFTTTQVKKISLRGGPAKTLCEARVPRVGVWSDRR